MSGIVGEAVRLALREDQEDLAVARAHARDKPLDDEAFLARLKADGTP
jgi:hypothetical protein